jgi:hypothetical protein
MDYVLGHRNQYTPDNKRSAYPFIGRGAFHRISHF